MQKNGCIKLTRAQADELAKVVLVEKTGKNGKVSKVVNRDCVGRDCKVILEKIGIKVGDDIRCAIAEVPFEHDFIQEELMMPILPIVRVSNIDQAIELAVKAEHGNRHTAHMHSKNIDNLSRFAKAVETTIFVKNAPSYAGIGFGGEGHTTFTIAGPTGEGITSARSFTRQRRCVMADSFRII
jgi:propionaldehyde dehydrogenase